MTNAATFALIRFATSTANSSRCSSVPLKPAGSGSPQFTNPVAPGHVGHASFAAASHTVMATSTFTSANSSSPLDRWPSIDTPIFSIVAIASGWMYPHGVAPALIALNRFPPTSRSNASAICDRQLLAVHKNRTPI